MLFDPDESKPWEQKIESVLRRRPDLRARMEAVAQSSGRSIREVVEACVHRYLDELEDPAYRAAEHARMDRREAPYGRDPLVKKDA